MKRFTLCLVFVTFAISGIFAQMANGEFGNEWIKKDQPYFKIEVSADGIYRIPFQVITNQGIELATERFQLFHLGEETPIYVGNNYIEFYAEKNRGELDQFLYKNGKSDMLNPDYSIITDTAAYFLTIAPPSSQVLRYEDKVLDLSNLPIKEEWYLAEVFKLYSNSYFNFSSGDFTESTFGSGDGYGLKLNLGEAFELKIFPTLRYDASINNHVQIRLLANGTNPHSFEMSINGEVLKTDNFGAYSLKDYTIEQIAGNQSDTIRLKINDLTGRFAVASVRVLYPHSFNFENQRSYSFNIAASDTEKYLEIDNFNTGNVAPVLYDLTNHLRFATALENGKVKIKLPPSAQGRQLILMNNKSGGFQTVNKLTPVNFIDYTNLNANYIIITSKRLRSDQDGADQVKAYADYRASNVGGSYKTLVVNIEDLYEQFAYGIPRHPLAIRNFGQYIHQHWENPRYVFLVGKGLEFPAIRNSGSFRNAYNAFFVPTFGNPGSDNLLLASNDSQTPLIPVGRLAAESPAEIKLYLNKIQQYEDPAATSDEARAWRKQIIHMGGGGDLAQQNQIRNNLNSLKSEMENNEYGASVYSFFKTSTDPIQLAQTDLLLEKINSGLSIITFFGHSSPTGFDFSLDDPANYDNKAKYPAIFSLGCYTGNFFYFKSSVPTERSIGENFIFQQDKGAIAFMGSSSEGSILPLYLLQKAYYEKMGGESYGKGLGDITQQVIQQFDNNNYSSLSYRSILQQLSLHGDPAVVLMPYEKPDYLIEKGSVNIAPTIISAQQDSFTLQFNVLNIGKAIKDSLLIEVSRAFPDGATYLAAEFKIPAPAYRDEVSLRLPVFGSRGVGSNKIFIKLNSDEHVAELDIPEAKSNNELQDANGAPGIDFYIYSNTVNPVYPPNFAILGKDSLSLSASTSNSTAPLQRYIIELDTTANFNSGFKKSKTLEQIGGLISWQPDIHLQDSTVYYWRISPDSTAKMGYLWQNNSFLYLKDSPFGWNQSHFYQFKKDQLVNMQLPETNRRWKFIDNVKTIKVGNTTFKGDGYYLPFAEIDGAIYGYQGYSNRIYGGLYVFVLDGATGAAWENASPGLYGSQIQWNTTAFPFNTQILEKRAAAIKFLEETIPSGDYVLIFTLQWGAATYEPEQWEADTDSLGTNLFNVLEEQGARLIRSTATTGARPYVFLYRKDDPSFEPIEILADSANQIIEKELSIFGNWDSGFVNTSTIGNAKSWSRLQWHVTPSDEYDQYSADVYGVRADSSSVLLMPGVVASDTTLNTIDAHEFPMLRLKWNAKDEIAHTSPQLDFWRVSYEGLPDAAIAPNLHLLSVQDTLQQGEPMRFEVAIANPSNYDFDSLLVKFSLVKDGVTVRQYTPRLKPLLHQDTLIASWVQDSRLAGGNYRLVVEVNPNNDQAESYRFNNIGIFEFFIQKDQRNPLLDVTFDGIRIMEGDLVSAKPQIVIELQDENRYLPLSDTSLFNIILESPNPDNSSSSIETQIRFSSTEQIHFYPAEADGKQNRARIEWTPAFTQSGQYSLIVQAKDVSGNASGQLDYKVNFEVITDARISNVLNYPNPFSTSTRFVYTMTGEEPPAYFTIQIMTISGRIVRQLTQADLGPLRIGTHQTDFAWDGTDEYGDRLANGVYLYRIIAKNRDGKNLNKYDNGTDRFFKNNIGKLVILR